MELADYPTTWYMTTSLFYRIIYFPIMIKDYLARYHYRKYVDRIAILKPIDKVFGIETLKTNDTKLENDLFKVTILI